MENPKKFQTIAQYLSAKNNTQKTTMKNGEVRIKQKIVKWTHQEDTILVNLMKKRSLAAIRRRLWDLFHQFGGEKESEKLKKYD